MEEQYSWDFSRLYVNDDDPQIALDITESKRVWESFVHTWKDTVEYLEKPQVLLAALTEYNRIYEQYGIVFKPLLYFVLRSETNKESESIKAQLAKVENEYIGIVNSIQFFSLSIARIQDPDRQHLLLQDVQLKPFKHYLESLFREGAYALSDNEERLVNMTVRPASTAWTEMVNKFVSQATREIEIRGKREVLPFGALTSMLVSPDSTVRKAVGEALHDINRTYSDIATEELNAILEYKRNIEAVKKYERPDTERHVSDDIDTEVVDALVDAVSRRYSISQTYYKKKASKLGLDRIKYYDRAAQIGSYSKTLTFDEMVTFVKAFYTRLDTELGDMVQDFIENRRLDVYPKKGKNTGGFCLSIGKLYPPYILMNYTGTLNDLLTLTHELGHGLHHLLTSQNTPGILCEVPMSLAEVASTFFEGYVLDDVSQLLETETEKEVLRYETVDQGIQTVFRQIALYKFEQELHERAKAEGYLSTEAIGYLFLTHMKAYMGDAVTFDEGSQYWWVYWSHIRNFFYVYSYASGHLISKALQAMVKESPARIKDVKKILSAGGSRSPKDLFYEVGIDITQKSFWDKGLDEIEAAVNSLPV